MNESLDGDPPGHTVPFDWTSLKEGLKVFIVIVLVLGGQGAVQAYSSVLDWSKINDAGQILHILVSAYHGLLAGLINGVARSVQVVMAIWAGPTVWKYASPVLTTAGAAVSRGVINFASLFKRTPKITL